MLLWCALRYYVGLYVSRYTDIQYTLLILGVRTKVGHTKLIVY